MDSSGKIIASNGKVLLSFGTAVVPVKYESFRMDDTYHIGVNLDTGKIDDIKSDFFAVLGLHELSEAEQKVLVKYLPVLHELKRNVMTVSAKARSGKDYLAEQVMGNIDDVQLVALGDAIRDVRNVLFGQPKGKDRAPLIMIGQGLRKEDPNIWIKVWLQRVTDLILRRSGRKFICQDVRQPNEFSFFRSMGALTVKVVADEEKRLNKIREIDGEAALDPKLLNDETESYAGRFNTDITIENDYTSAYAMEIETKVIKALKERGW